MNAFAISGVTLRSGLVLGLALLFSACNPSPPPRTAAPLPVKTYQLGADTSPDVAQFPATIVRDRESNLSFRVGGIIQTLDVRAGQWVQAGQTLAVLKPTPYAASRARAESEVNRLQHAARRNEELLKAGAVSQGTKEDTEDALAAATAALGAAQYDEESTRIKAPFSGLVLSRDAESGETVAPGQRVLRIADMGSTVLAKAAVPSQRARSLRPGGAAQLRLGEGSLAASIRTIGALSDPKTGTVTVDLVLPQGAAIASGSLGAVAFLQPAAANPGAALRLPPEALLESKGGQGAVFVLDVAHAVARRTPVTVLGWDGEWVRIRGLEPGVKVLTTGAGFAVDGQAVQEIAP